MTWLIFSFAALLLTVSYGLVSKKALNNEEKNLDSIAYASATFIIVGIVTLLISFLTDFSTNDFLALVDPNIAGLLILNLLFYTIAPSFYYPALKKLPLSIVIIIYSLSGFFTFIIGTLFNQNSFTYASLFGSLLIFLSVIIVTLRGRDLKISRYIPLVVVSTIFYSAAATIDQRLIGHFSTSFYLGFTFGIPGVLLLIVNRVPWDKIRQPYLPKNYLAVFFYGLFASTSFYCVFMAFRTGGTAASVYSILATEAVVSVVASAIFLHERKHMFTKIIAALIASLGVYLLIS